ncbi:MAG: efflux RND transporter periplasmic adaptor subunit [Acidobacteria bacterium]|nr:efflux RND transporter periplasmic adaptor subunit [Acidobacteriota bacterium]
MSVPRMKFSSLYPRLAIFATAALGICAWMLIPALLHAHGEVAGGGRQTFVQNVTGANGNYRVEIMYSPSLPVAGEIANVEIKAFRLLAVPDPLLGTEIPLGLQPEGSLVDTQSQRAVEPHLPVHPEGEAGVFGIAEHQFSKAGSFNLHFTFKTETGDEFSMDFPITVQSNPASFFRLMVNIALVLLVVGLTAIQLWRVRQQAGEVGGAGTRMVRPALIGLACLIFVVGVMDRFILPAVLNMRKPAVPTEGKQFVILNEDGTYAITDAAQKELGITLVEAKLVSLDQIVRATGHVEARPDLTAIVEAPLWGRIEFAPKPLSLGETVKRGQQLAVVTLELSAIERGPMEAKDLDINGVLARARERRDAAQLELDRTQKLAAANPLYEADAKWAKELRDEAVRIFDEVRKQDEAMEATKKFRDPRRTPVGSPINGIIASINFTPGELNLNDEYKQLFTIVDPSRVWVKTQVYSSDLLTLKRGQSASIFPPSPGAKPMSGTVHWIGDTIDSTNRSVPVIVDVVNEGNVLALESFVRAEFRRQQRVLAVPEQAVIDTGTERWVYIVRADGNFAAQPVEVGIRQNGFWQVLSGIGEGDRVVVNGAGMLGALPRQQSESASYAVPAVAVQ